VWRVGFLGARSRSTPSNPDVYYDAFVQGMREHGYVEGRNLAIEWRFAAGNYERFPVLAAELVAAKPDVIVTHVMAATRALQRTTSTIPIVSTGINDPVGSGIAVSLARPAGNVTGLANVALDASSKRLELLADMVPNLSRVAVLLNPGNPARNAIFKRVQEAAERLGIQATPLDARNADEIERGFASIAQQRVQAVVVANDALYLGRARQLADVSLKNRLPTIFPYREIVVAGGLMSFGQDFADTYRRAAIYVDKILKGAKPGDLPVEQPTRLELVLNRTTAKRLGLSIPHDLQVRADKVID
jgi:putative tryptophan/tyrosine transport system substrate-binding protein